MWVGRNAESQDHTASVLAVHRDYTRLIVWHKEVTAQHKRDSFSSECGWRSLSVSYCSGWTLWHTHTKRYPLHHLRANTGKTSRASTERAKPQKPMLPFHRVETISALNVVASRAKRTISFQSDSFTDWNKRPPLATDNTLFSLRNKIPYLMPGLLKLRRQYISSVTARSSS